MIARRHLLALAGAAALLTVASALPGDASAAAHAARTYTIELNQMKFGPLPSGLHLGDTIIWANHDIFRHTATANDRSFDIDLPPGKSARLVVKRAGKIPFFCKFHPGMKGLLIVAP